MTSSKILQAFLRIFVTTNGQTLSSPVFAVKVCINLFPPCKKIYCNAEVFGKFYKI